MNRLTFFSSFLSRHYSAIAESRLQCFNNRKKIYYVFQLRTLLNYSDKTSNEKTGGWSDGFRARTIKNYTIALAVVTLGLSYAAVPLYAIFCQATGFGGTVSKHDVNDDKIKTMTKNPLRIITVKFNSDLAANMAWKFKPQQKEIKVMPGETALAFYTATNPTDKPIIGVSTYNVVPFEAGPYFNKIQCFCFEEQMLNPYEQVDMPVFFYIDPDFAEDPKLEYVNEIMLSYTFFEAKEGLKIPVPSFLKNKNSNDS